DATPRSPVPYTTLFRSGLAYTINTQGIPPFVINRWGEDALENCASVSWDTTPPKDLNAEANSLVTSATAVKALTEALGAHGETVDVKELCSRFGIPLKQREMPRLELVEAA